MKNKPFVLGWWSAGVTSAVACKMAIELYDNVELYYIHIDSANKDNTRFMLDCQDWYGQKINSLKSKKYSDQFDVIEKTKYINGVGGARCTLELKKQVRYDFEKVNELSLFNQKTISNQVWGFEFLKNEINRAIRFGQQYPKTKPLFPLIEKGLNKNECAALLINAGIKLPEMYILGYNNNNCIGCVKGGKGYWNKIRVDFPAHFNRMSELERKVGHSCINCSFLDELDPTAGRKTKEIMPNCGVICEVDFSEIPDKSLEEVIKGNKTIYEAINQK